MAQIYGGAISVQILNNVEINIYCSIIIILSHHLDYFLMITFIRRLNEEGRAIYINPTYYHNCQGDNDYMPQITIKDSTIESNTAYDGDAYVYIEGDEYKTTFNIQNNQFNNNFNESNHHTEKPNLISGAIIATDIHSITNTSLNNNANIFAYDNKDLHFNLLSYVDLY